MTNPIIDYKLTAKTSLMEDEEFDTFTQEIEIDGNYIEATIYIEYGISISTIRPGFDSPYLGLAIINSLEEKNPSLFDDKDKLRRKVYAIKNEIYCAMFEEYEKYI